MQEAVKEKPCVPVVQEREGLLRLRGGGRRKRQQPQQQADPESERRASNAKASSSSAAAAAQQPSAAAAREHTALFQPGDLVEVTYWHLPKSIYQNTTGTQLAVVISLSQFNNITAWVRP